MCFRRGVEKRVVIASLCRRGGVGSEDLAIPISSCCRSRRCG